MTSLMELFYFVLKKIPFNKKKNSRGKSTKRMYTAKDKEEKESKLIHASYITTTLILYALASVSLHIGTCVY